MICGTTFALRLSNIQPNLDAFQLPPSPTYRCNRRQNDFLLELYAHSGEGWARRTGQEVIFSAVALFREAVPAIYDSTERWPATAYCRVSVARGVRQSAGKPPRFPER